MYYKSPGWFVWTGGVTGRNGNSQRSSDLHSKSRSDIPYDSAYRICLSITCQTLFLALIKFLLILLPFFFRNSNSFHETLIMPRTDIEHNRFQFQLRNIMFCLHCNTGPQNRQCCFLTFLLPIQFLKHGNGV